MRLERANAEELKWLEDTAPCWLSRNARGIAARQVNSFEPLCVVAFDGWTPNATWVHFAVRDPKVFWGQTIREAWKWVFSHVGILLSTTRSSNARSIRFQRGLGFREVARVQDGYAEGEDLIIMQLRREDSRHWRM